MCDPMLVATILNSFYSPADLPVLKVKMPWFKSSWGDFEQASLILTPVSHNCNMESMLLLFYYY